MNPNLQRGILLFQQSRHELAEAELRQALAAEPQHDYAHALLALCLAEREQFADATAEAQQAIHLGPDFPFAHYALARVYYDRHHYREALAAIQEAIRLDSTDADYFSLLGAIHLEERRWPAALSAADQGLQLDPEHVGCANLRAMAMVKLGRKIEAGETISAALSKNPDNALTHANQGWTLLEKGDPKQALHHFHEALRLDPENEWARQGIVEALKARNIIYAVMLKYFLWMARFSRRAQWGIVIGGVLGNRMLGALAASNPELTPWVLPLRLLYVSFALMTWLSYPLFNLLLRLSRFGRLALSREQTVASTWFGLCLMCALLGLASCFWQTFEVPWLMAALVFGFLLMPVSATFRCPGGWRRRTMAGLTIGLALFGVAAIVFTLPALEPARPDANESVRIGWGLFEISMFGSVASTWLANLLATQQPRR